MTNTESNNQPVELPSSSSAERPQVDLARVARLRREIAAGSYVVDPEAIAAALLAAGALTVENPD